MVTGLSCFQGQLMRVCSRPGCPTLYDDTHSRCPAHRREADKARGTATQRGYTSRGHQRFRRETLTRDPICVICDAAQSTIADHYPLTRRELEQRGLDPNNPDAGRGLCKPCHDRWTAASSPGGFNH